MSVSASASLDSRLQAERWKEPFPAQAAFDYGGLPQQQKIAVAEMGARSWDIAVTDLTLCFERIVGVCFNFGLEKLLLRSQLLVFI